LTVVPPASAGPTPCRERFPGLGTHLPTGACSQIDEIPFDPTIATVHRHSDFRGPAAGVAERTRPALERSFEVFTPLGLMPTEVAVVLVPELSGDEFAFAQADGSTCVVVVPFSTYRDPELFQHTMAHELFHCFQFKQVGDRVFTVAGGPGDWWFEGTAEYFANVAYPNEDIERYYLEGLRAAEPNRALVDLAEDAYVFFQFLANQQGDAAVVQFMNTMPTSGGRVDQIEAAAAWPNMDALFHEYARAFLSNGIIDTSGEFIPIVPELDTLGIREVDGPGNVFRLDGIKPFLIPRIRLYFEELHEFDLEYVTDPGVRTGAQLGGNAAPWEEGLPDPLETCSNEQRWRLIMTTTEPGTPPGVTLDVAEAIDRSAEELPLSCCAEDAAARRLPRAVRGKVVITVCGAIDAQFVGGVCYVENAFLNVVAGYGVFDDEIEATGPYPRGYALILGTDQPGTEPAGFPDVSIGDDTGAITGYGSSASLTKSRDLRSGTFVADDIAGSYSCPRLTPTEELDEREG
jgi:hypothetical protein